MAYTSKISNCKICEEEYTQTRIRYVVCSKPACKKANKKLGKKDYDARVKSGIKYVHVYKPLILDTATAEVRRINKFLVSFADTNKLTKDEVNACSFR